MLPESDISAEPTFVLSILLHTGLTDLIIDSTIPFPLTLWKSALLISLLIVGSSNVLSHDYLSIHLHVAMQFSICHHPDYLIHILEENKKKSTVKWIGNKLAKLNFKEDFRTEFISTSHSLAKELLNKPDGFITTTLGEKEYVIGNTQRVASHANIDDTVTHWTLNLRDGGNGNIKR